MLLMARLLIQWKWNNQNDADVSLKAYSKWRESNMTNIDAILLSKINKCSLVKLSKLNEINIYESRHKYSINLWKAWNNNII